MPTFLLQVTQPNLPQSSTAVTCYILFAIYFTDTEKTSTNSIYDVQNVTLNTQLAYLLTYFIYLLTEYGTMQNGDNSYVRSCLRCATILAGHIIKRVMIVQDVLSYVLFVVSYYKWCVGAPVIARTAYINEDECNHPLRTNNI